MINPVAAKGEMPATFEEFAQEYGLNLRRWEADTTPPELLGTYFYRETIIAHNAWQAAKAATPSPAPSSLEERVAFEKWARQYHPEFAWQEFVQMYLPNSVQYGWVAWQARAAFAEASSLERDWRKIAEELLVANKRVEDLTAELAAEVLKKG